MFDYGGEMTFSSSYRESKNEGLRNQDYAVITRLS